MKRINFWDEFCKYCDQRCCKTPIFILPQEKDAIVKSVGKEAYFEGHGSYFILRGEKGPCPFLKNRKCGIHKIKPSDCKAYPIFIKQKNSSMEWRIDRDCPASYKLPEEVINFAKRLFLKLNPQQRELDYKIACEAGFNLKKI